MPNSSDRHAVDSSENGLSRRQFVESVGATGVAAGLAGCSGDGGGGDEGTTVGNSGNGAVTITWNTHDYNDEDKKALAETLEAELPDHISVELADQPGETTDDTRSQYNQWLSSGRASPDIITPDTAWSIPYVVRDQVVNLSDHMSQESLDYMKENYVSQLQPTMTDSDGNFYGVQHNTDIAGIQYRKDLVEQAGYDPDGENWATEGMTWQEFSQMIADVQKQNPDIDYGFTFQGRAYEGLSCCNYNEWMTSFGGAYFGGRDNLFGPVGDRPATVDEEPHYQALRMVRTFIHGESDEHSLDGYAGNISPPATLQWAEGTSLQPFIDGNAIANRNWPTTWSAAGAEDAFGEDLGVMPIPSGVPDGEGKYEDTGGIGRSFVGGWTCMVNPNSENLEEAVQVVEAMVGNEKFRATLFERTGHLPPDISLLESGALEGLGVVSRYLDVLRTTAPRAIPRAATVAWGPESAEISQEVNSCLNQEKSPEQAMDDLKSSIQDIEAKLAE